MKNLFKNNKQHTYYYEHIGGVADLGVSIPILTQSILAEIYKTNGVIHYVYKSIGCKLKNTHADIVIQKRNHFYINKQAQVQQIFPSYVYQFQDQEPQSLRLSGILQTVQNKKALQRFINTSTKDDIDWLRFKLAQENTQTNSIEKWINTFKEIYEQVFKINIKAQHVLKKNKEEQKSIIQLSLPKNSKTWIGNSLDIADTRDFFAITHSQNVYSQELLNREYARWVTVKHMQKLRVILDVLAKQHYVATGQLHKYSIQDLQKERLPQLQSISRSPNRVISNLSYKNTKKSDSSINTHTTILSPGKASGQVVNLKTIVKQKNTNQILYIDRITNNIIGLLPYVKAVVTNTGSELLHPVIIMREMEIPCIKINKQITVGTAVTIDSNAIEPYNEQ